MFARISTYFNCTEEELWEKIIEPRSLQFVASPILSFRPLIEEDFDSEWVTDKTYELKLYFLNFLPLGHHRMKLVRIDRESNTIVSKESGMLAQVWNHTIRFQQDGQRQLKYTDEIEIKAGLLTLAIWVFAHLFYCHRQRRWKILLKSICG